MSVYLIWAEGTNFFKIGYSKNVRSRLSDFRVACPHELHIAATVETDTPERLEAEFHTKWAKYKIKGEWFDIPLTKWPDLLSSYGYHSVLIKRLIENQCKATKEILGFYASFSQSMREMDALSVRREMTTERSTKLFESGFEEASGETRKVWRQYQSLQRVTLNMQRALAGFLNQSTEEELQGAVADTDQALLALMEHNKRYHDSDTCFPSPPLTDT